MTDKFCIDCEFCFNLDCVPLCKHPANGINPVDGDIQVTLATVARGDYQLAYPDWDMCGSAGKHWMKRATLIEPKQWWRFWK